MADDKPFDFVDVIIHANTKDIAEALAEHLDGLTGENIQFALMIYRPRTDARIHFIANGKIEEIQNALKGTIEKLDAAKAPEDTAN